MRKPAPSTALAKPPAPPKPPPLVSASLAALELAIGGREALVAALSHAPKSRDLDHLLGLVGDPARASWALADLCAEGGVTAGEVIESYKAGVIAAAQAVALQRVGALLGDVASDTMRLALPHEVTCTDCHGTGTVTPEPTKKAPNPQPGPCDTCGGTGTIPLEGDLEHKKLALDMGKLLPRSGGVNLSVQQNVATFTGMSAGGTLERMQELTDKLLFGNDLAESTVVDVEPVGMENEAADEEEACVEGDWREDPH